jgi:hypothetical protein
MPNSSKGYNLILANRCSNVITLFGVFEGDRRGYHSSLLHGIQHLDRLHPWTL